MHGGVYFRMTEEFLHLLNGHPFANGISGQGAPELMGGGRDAYRGAVQFCEVVALWRL